MLASTRTSSSRSATRSAADKPATKRRRRYKIVEKTVDPPWHAPNKAWAGELAGQTIPPGDPRNPLAARWLGIADGQGIIHGTKDIEPLGSAASHGCIRMSVKAVKELYRQVKKGTPVFLQ